MKLLVTGGAGFIGSAFIRMGIRDGFEILNLDKLTYAGNLDNLTEVVGNPRYSFVQGDICEALLVRELLAVERPDAVVHFAAESHVDRSIKSPSPAFETNLRGTFTLLEAVRAHPVSRFLHVSTDEVYGSVEPPLEADESFSLEPNSPYSASKAGSDLLARSYWKTYNVPVTTTRASNNYGPCQYPEKLIPLMILEALNDRPLPVYGDGMQIRDWLHVDDHCRAIFTVLQNGRAGEIYNIGGNRSLPNLEVVHKILAATGRPASLIRGVQDRPGHDRRYALSSAKLMRETGWKPEIDFESGLAATVEWYRDNPKWVARARRNLAR